MTKKCFVFFVFLLITIQGVFAQPTPNWYQGKPIKLISFVGLKNVDKTELTSLFEEYKNEPFSNTLYVEILQKLYALEYFKTIEVNALPHDPDYKEVQLEFTVSELPFINGIEFNGNKHIRSGELLSKTLLKKGDIFNETKLHADEQAIRNHYLEKGYATVEVQSSFEQNSEQNSTTIRFTINEGKQTIISSISFSGNKNVTEKQLKKILLSKEARFLETGAFKTEHLEQDRQAIAKHYSELGYIDAHVEDIIKTEDTESDPQKKLLSLTYTIMEGERYTYGGIDIIGAEIFNTEDLYKHIRLKKGDKLNMVALQTGFEKIVDTYYENGYTSNSFDLQTQRDEEAKQVFFILTIVERSRSHIENIRVVGNTKTKEHIILRELLYQEGDVYSKSKFVDSLRNLFNLRYFKSIIPDVQPGSAEDLLDVTLNVEEQSTASIQFGITFSGISDIEKFPLSVFLEWEDTNLMGYGNSLSIKGTAGASEQNINIGYTENWFLGTPLSVGFNFSITHQKLFSLSDALFPRFSDDEYNTYNGKIPPDPFSTWEEYLKNPSLAESYRMKYNRLQIGFGITSGYRWFPAGAMITLRGGINFFVVKNFYNASRERSIDPTIRNEQKKWSLNNSLWLQTSFDGRDFAFDPSKGWFFSQKIAFFGLFPKLEQEYFFQSETKAEAYATLLDYPVSDVWNLKFVLAFYSGFSFQVPITEKKIGISNQFRIDGMFHGRGWQNLADAGLGNVMLYHWTEFRWPLAHGILSFDFFFDAIAVKKDLQDLQSLSINDYYFSFGPGLRFTIQQFPLRLMFANTFRSNNGKPYWGNGKGADWKFVLSFNFINL